MAEPITLETPQEVKSPVAPVTGSSSENTISGEGSVATETQQPVKTVPAEVEEWNRLKGNTQERIRELLQLRDALVEENKTLKNSYTPPPAPPVAPTYQPPVAPTQSGTMTREQQDAVEALRGFGLLTKKDMEDLQDNIVLEQEYNKLEGKFSGADGRPMFERTEIEDHMRKTGIYNPEKAYEDLYREELYDWRSKQTQQNDPPVYSTRPSGSTASRTEPLTVDSLRERMARPDGKDWWEKNRERILPQLGQLLAG